MKTRPTARLLALSLTLLLTLALLPVAHAAAPAKLVSAETDTTGKLIYLTFDQPMDDASLAAPGATSFYMLLDNFTNRNENAVSLRRSTTNNKVIVLQLKTPVTPIDTGLKLDLYRIDANDEFHDYLLDANQNGVVFNDAIAVTNRTTAAGFGNYKVTVNGHPITGTASGDTITVTIDSGVSTFVTPVDARYYPVDLDTTFAYIKILDPTITALDLRMASKAMYKDVSQLLICTSRTTMGYLSLDGDFFKKPFPLRAKLRSKAGEAIYALYDKNGAATYNATLGIYNPTKSKAYHAAYIDGKTAISVPRSGCVTSNEFYSGADIFTLAVVNKNGTYRTQIKQPATLTDVPSWAKTAVNYLNVRGVVNGTGNNKFSPDLNVKRCDFIFMLMKALQPDISTSGTKQFSDVSSSQYYATAVLQARKLGIVGGSGDNKFNPNASITRQDIAAMLARAMKTANLRNGNYTGKELSDFADSNKVAAYAVEPMELMLECGIIGGSKGLLNPTAPATRAEAALMIYRLLYGDLTARASPYNGK